MAFALSVGLAAEGESRISLSGTVVDAEGNPVADAAVVVAEGSEIFRAWRERSRGVAVPAVLGKATSDAVGMFTVDLPDDVAELNGRRSRLTVWAYHPGAAVSVRLIDRDWLAAGLSLRLALGRAAPLRLKVVGEDWRPIAHARIAPHRVADQLMPAAIADGLAVTTDSKGIAELTDFAHDELDAVRVEHETCGIQWTSLPRPDIDSTAIVSLAPVGHLSGRLTADNAAAIRGRKLRFITWRVPDDDSMGMGVAEVVTDDEGKFDVSAIAAGSLTFEIKEDGLPSPSPALEGHPPSTAPVYLSAQTTGPQVEPQQRSDFEIPLRRATLVAQEVRDRDDGTPIAGVVVSFNWAESNDVEATTDASGQCRAYLLSGMFTPRASHIPPPYYKPGVFLDTQVVPEKGESLSFQPMRLAWRSTTRPKPSACLTCWSCPTCASFTVWRCCTAWQP